MNPKLFSLLALTSTILGTSIDTEPDTPVQRVIDKEKVNNNRLTPFTYGDRVIYALTQKNADRKAKKQNLI